ncbi:MAG: hypothetical protein LUH22_19595 [Bacteroides sp.]|nr:hypothetical protein [Bacteroides sp.]
MERNKLGLIITALLFLLGITGCMSEDIVGPDVNPNKPVKVQLEIPGFDIPKTRSIDGDKGEAVVQALDILIFDNSTPAELTEHVQVTDFTQGSSDTSYQVDFELKLTDNPDARTLVVVANAANQVQAALQGQSAGLAKQAFLEALKFSTAKKDDTYEWNTSDNYTPIPMYGETPINGISNGRTVSGIFLTRMLARIDVENKVQSHIFKLEEIYLVNYNTAGYIAPAWNTGNGVILEVDDDDYPYSGENPMIPANAGKQPPTEAGAILYEYDEQTPDSGVGKIYTYEAAKAEGDEEKDKTAACLIVKGIYKGATNYYRIDFTKSEDGVSPGEVKYMPLYRNHKYVVTITAAEGDGYTSFKQALESTSVLSNLKTKLLVSDMNGINNIVYDGQYYLGTENEIIEILWGKEKQWTENVESNYKGAWTAVIESGYWLKFADGNRSFSGTDIDTNGIPLKADKLSSFSEEQAKIHITCGRLKLTLIIKRISISSLFARSNVVYEGSPGSGKLTFAVTENDNIYYPAYSQGVVFKWGSLIAFSPVGNPYTPDAHVIYNPTNSSPYSWGIGLAGWDNVPYAHSKFGFGSSGTGDDYDAFDGYEGKGFSTQRGIGDICRYISGEDEANGKPRWIVGDWRMPTYAEMIMLHEETKVVAKKGSFEDKTAAPDASQLSNQSGMYNPESGWMLGAKVNNTAVTDTRAHTPLPGTVYLPMSGHRYPNGDGDIVHVGAYGYYWTASPYDNITVNYLHLNQAGREDYDADRSYAFPIRCIKNYE